MPITHTQFPNAYAEDDSTAFVPLPEDLFLFLFTTRKPNTARLVLGLLLRRAFDGSSDLVQIRQKALAKVTGINVANIGTCVGSPDFRELVNVEEGKPAKLGVPGVAATYDVSPLWVALKSWRVDHAHDENVRYAIARGEGLDDDDRAYAIERGYLKSANDNAQPAEASSSAPF